MPPDEHQIANAAVDQVVLDALILKEIEGGIDEGKGAQSLHGLTPGELPHSVECQGRPFQQPGDGSLPSALAIWPGLALLDEPKRIEGCVAREEV